MKNKSKIKTIIITLGMVSAFLSINNYNLIDDQGNSEEKMDFYNETDLKVAASNITIATPENKTYVGPMSGYYPAVYGFEDQKVGSAPYGWPTSGDPSSGSYTVRSEWNNHKMVLEQIDNSTSGFYSINQSFSSGQTTGIFEFYIGFPQIRPYNGGMILGNENNDPSIYIMFEGSYIKYYDGIRHKIQEYFPNRWYHIRFVFNSTSDTYDIYINDLLSSSNIGFWNMATTLNYFISPGSTPATYTAYYDAIGYSWDPDYNIADNLNEGLLLSIENSNNLEWKGYSLDRQVNRTILGNTTIQMPPDGLHTIQVFGNDSLGTIYQSNIRYFTVDIGPPNITIISPGQYDFFGSTAPNFEISIVEPNLNTTWYTLDDGLINKIFTGLTGEINQTEWDKKGHGAVTIRFYANDSFGREEYGEVIINKDLNPPTSLVSFIPYWGINEVNRSTAFILTADDGLGSGVSVIKYKINNSAWADYTGPFDLSSYDYGYYLISYQAIDLVNNIETENTILVRLVELPSLTVTTPDSSSSWETGTSRYINWTSTGSILNIKIELYKNGEFEMEITSSTTNNGEYYWNLPSELADSNQYQVKITDVSNPSTYDYSDYFEIKNPPSGSPAIPGYNMFLLIGIICVVSVILIKKRIKNKL